MYAESTWTDAETLDVYRVLVTFRLGVQIYALPIEPIVRIIEMVTITPIPRVNHSVRGVINMHGEAVPVIDVRQHLGLPTVPYGLHTPIIVVQVGDRAVGLVVDQVEGVLNLQVDKVVRPDDMLPQSLRHPLFPQVAQTEQGTVLVLDMDRLFSPQEASVISHEAVDLAGVRETVLEAQEL